MKSFRRLDSARTMLCVIAAICSFGAAQTRAVILLGDGNPATNTTAPTGDLAGSGWQFEGTFGPFLGTPIAPSFFMTAKHVGGSDSVFYFNGIGYPLVRQYSDAFTDLTIWQISGTFPAVAPLYSSGNETGQRLVVFGRGTQRGGEVLLNSVLHGWFWGPNDAVQRWGENIVAAIVHDGPANAYIFGAFDQDGSPNESHLSSGDSGGAVFIQEAGVWKLAGINYAVDGPLYMDAAGDGQFTAAIFDARGFYQKDSDNPPHYSQIAGAKPQPTGFYSTQISSKLGWIYSVIDPTGDVDGNGNSNLLDYARALNSAPPAGPNAIPVTKEGNALTFTYRKLTVSPTLQYVVKKSGDLVGWIPVTPTETLLGATDDMQNIKASVPMTGTPMFLRVEITQTP